MTAAATAVNGWILITKLLLSPSIEDPSCQMWLGIQIGVAVLSFTVYMVVARHLKQTGGEEWAESMVRLMLVDIGGMFAVAAFLPIVVTVAQIVIAHAGESMVNSLRENSSTP